MDDLIIIPDGSIYLWMYNMGLKHVPVDRLEAELVQSGRPVRDKDWVKHSFIKITNHL